MLDTNVLGLCMCSREAFAMMRQNEISNKDSSLVPGHIININSIAGHMVISQPFFHFYSASKFAVNAATEGMRQVIQFNILSFRTKLNNK